VTGGLYDDPELAARYADATANNVCNAAYERPAMRAVAGGVAELDVLDAGCAAGEHAAWLTASGARTVALDVSPAMVALTRARLGSAARVVEADLAQSLPFAAGSFDLVFSSLTLHYLEDWLPPLREFARVLRPGGRLVFSTHHPFMTIDEVPAYHRVTLVEQTWTGFGPEPVRVRFYHRPFARMLADLDTARFRLRGLHEPVPAPEAEARDPALAARLRERPWFVILDAVRGD
jgi:SAM-dependent methyltransferase